MQKLGTRVSLPDSTLPVPLPVVAAGAALTVITSAVMLSYLLPSDGDAGTSVAGRSASLSTPLSERQLSEIDGPWQAAYTPLPAASTVVSAEPTASGFAVVLQRGDAVPAGSDAAGAGMQVSYVDGAGAGLRDVRPVLPQSWLLTHAHPLDDGHTVVLGQTTDGLFLFRVDRAGQPIWGRFEGAGEGAGSGADLHQAGDLLVIASPSPRGLGLGLVAYDMDGGRVWSETLPGLVAGGYSVAGTLTGDVMIAADVAAEGGNTRESRFIRMDRAGVVQLDQPLELTDGNAPRRIAVASDGGAFLVSTGTSAVLHRLSPRGAEQWRADLPSIPPDGEALPDLGVLADGAVVSRVDRQGLHIARVDGSGLDVQGSTTALPGRLESLGLRTAKGGDIISVIMAGVDPARPELVHVEGDLRDVLNAPKPPSGTAPTRTVSVEGLPPPVSSGGRGIRETEAPELRRAPDLAIERREPVIEAEQPRPVAVNASNTASSPPAPAEGPSQRVAECQFICMPDGVPAAKYPVKKTYALTGGLTLNDIVLEAFADHDILCLQSSGLAHSGSVPICEES